MENTNNIVYTKDFENRKRYREREKYVEAKRSEISEGYKSDIKLFVKYCELSGQEENSESLLDYLYISILEHRVKKTTWEKRLVANRKYLLVVYGIDLTSQQKSELKELRKMYKEEEQAELNRLEGKSPVNKEMLIDKIDKLGTRERAICIVNLVTANRPSEMVRLRIRDFDLAVGNVSVYLKKQKIWHNKRLTAKAVDYVQEYIKEYKLKQDDFFVGRVFKHGRYESSKISENSYRERLQAWTGLTPYNFRKTQVTSMHVAGADLSTIASQTGHQSLETINNHYLKVSNVTVDKYL